jgi:hypothetical protein
VPWGSVVISQVQVTYSQYRTQFFSSLDHMCLPLTSVNSKGTKVLPFQVHLLWPARAAMLQGGKQLTHVRSHMGTSFHLHVCMHSLSIICIYAVVSTHPFC